MSYHPSDRFFLRLEQWQTLPPKPAGWHIWDRGTNDFAGRNPNGTLKEDYMFLPDDKEAAEAKVVDLNRQNYISVVTSGGRLSAEPSRIELQARRLISYYYGHLHKGADPETLFLCLAPVFDMLFEAMADTYETTHRARVVDSDHA